MDIQHKVSTWVIDNVPALIRHPISIFVGTFFAWVFGAIVANKGVTTIPDWGVVLEDSFNNAMVATVGTMVVLFGTPATNAYGVGSSVPDPIDDHNYADSEPVPLPTPGDDAVVVDDEVADDGLDAALDAEDFMGH